MKLIQTLTESDTQIELNLLARSLINPQEIKSTLNMISLRILRLRERRFKFYRRKVEGIFMEENLQCSRKLSTIVKMKRTDYLY